MPETRTYVKYLYDEGKLPEYRAALEQRGATWLRETEKLLTGWVAAGGGGSRSRKIKQQLVDEGVAKVDKCLLGAYNATFTRVSVTKGGKKRPPRAPGDNLQEQIVARESAKADVRELAAVRGMPRERIEVARNHLREVTASVHRELFARQQAKARDVAAKLDLAEKTDPRAFASTFKEFTEKRRLPLPATMVSSGRLVRDKGAIRQLWVDRFRKPVVEQGDQSDMEFRRKVMEVVNGHRVNGADVVDAGIGMESECTQEEIKKALDKSKTGKSPDAKGVTNEMTKRSGQFGIRLLTALVSLLLLTECFPTEWQTSILNPAHKKGDPQFASNYRPLGITAILYKLYERVLDCRLRVALYFLPAQCGFRPGFGPHNILAKIEILIKHCVSHDIDLQLIMLDFKEAFERVWRPAILARLYQAGVKGKLWRIVDAMLKETWSAVRTQFGTTDRFRTWIGVIQGTVLGPLFFLLFITPMAAELRTTSANIKGHQTSPFLFADDATLAAVGEKAMQVLLTQAIMWARRWNALISEDKSGVLRVLGRGDAYSPTELCGMRFEERDLYKLLGVYADREGLFTAAFVKSLLARAHPRLESLLKLREGVGSARMGTVCKLYVMMVASVTKYSIPFAGASPNKMHKIRLAQRAFARNLLGMEKDFPGRLAAEAVGMMDIDLISAQERIMMHQRLLANPEEVDYRAMMHWELRPGGSSTNTMVTKLLKTLDIPLDAAVLGKVDKDSLRGTVQAAAMRHQHLRMEKRRSENGHALVQQPYWGVEKALLDCRAGLAVPYIRLRLGDRRELDLHTPACNCAQPRSLNHTLWVCERTNTCRRQLRHDLGQAAPPVHDYFMALQGEAATQFVLGKGALVFQGPEWSVALPLFASYLAHIRVLGRLP